MTRVLPEPAPASTRHGPPRWCTASSWAGLSVGGEDDTGAPGGKRRRATDHSGARGAIGSVGADAAALAPVQMPRHRQPLDTSSRAARDLRRRLAIWRLRDALF